MASTCACQASENTGDEALREVAVDLSKFAGQPVLLELVNRATGWHYETAYWADIQIKHQ